MNVSIEQIKPNPNNPRLIKDSKYEKLKRSLQEFPGMLEKRPLVCYTDTDGKYVILGGNMRYKAAKELEIKELPIILADDWTIEQKQEFLIKDNLSFGEWNMDELANTWNVEQLNDWGMDVPVFKSDDLTNMFFDNNDEGVDVKKKIVLEYTDEEYEMVKEELLKHGKTYEEAVYKILFG